MATISEILIEIKKLQEEIKKSNLLKKPFYTTKETAALLGVSVSYIQKLIASKQITHFRPKGKITYLRQSDLEDFVLKNPIYSEDEVDSIVANNLLNLKCKLQ